MGWHHMTRLLATTALCALATAAVAADLPTRKAPLPALVASGFNWDGFYVGLNFGAAKGGGTWSRPTGNLLLFNTPRFNAKNNDIGVFGGATVGVNKQFGAFVVGLEGDISASSLYGNAVCGGEWGLGGVGWACKNRTKLLGSLDLRAGYATGAALFYAKGGLAYARNKLAIEEAPYYPFPVAASNKSRWGWNVGAGVEYAMGGGWSAKGEYDYYSFAGRNFSSITAAMPNRGAIGARAAQHEHLIKFGLNYRFGGGSDVAAPAPAIASDLTGEFGARAGWSTGKFKFTLWDPYVRSQMNSRLTWPKETGMMAEGFARLDHTSGVFVKGLVGGLAHTGAGKMHDEDFPPAAVPYSDTVSSTKNGNTIYGSLDVGFAALRGAGWKLGAFVGYNYLEERVNAYGCTQVAKSSICASGAIPSGSMGLSRNEKWQSVRVGLAGEMMLTDRLKLSADAAWLPYVRFTGNDNHWFRPDINPLADSGRGHNGYQLEAIASYKLTDRVSLGVGARYWKMSAKGHTQFPWGVPSSPTRYDYNRSTVFLQASYAFGGPAEGALQRGVYKP